MKQLFLIFVIGSLAGCGGYHKAKRDGGTPTRTVSAPIAVTPTVVGVTTPGGAPAATLQARAVPVPQPARKPYARGQIERACMASDRKARSRELCGCIQAVADDTLSGAQQRRAVSFYRDPHAAQEVRQSDSPGDEAFWADYRAFGDRAERVCR